MTKDESGKVLEVVLAADGNCAECAMDLVLELEKRLPGENWAGALENSTHRNAKKVAEWVGYRKRNDAASFHSRSFHENLTDSEKCEICNPPEKP